MPKISDLTAATSAGDSDVLPIIQSGATKKVTRANFLSPAGIDTNANLTLSVPSGVQETKGGVNFTHTNGTGTSQYRITQDDYDLMSIKRTGDTTGDGNVWTIVQIKSPTEAEDTTDSEATISLITRNGTPSSYARTLDIYNDEYSRDNGMGFRQLYKNVSANPLRFELHDKTTNNGAWTMTNVSVTSGSPNGSYASTAGVTPSAEDWIWDNAGTYFADDTKILSIDTGAKTFVLNRNATATSSTVSARGRNIKEIARFTPARQLLVRKYIASSATTVAEFGGGVVVDGTLNLSVTATPASSGATGVKGDIAWDTSYIYVCTATNTWKRVAIATW